MDFPAVSRQLQDLPTTFMRPGAPYVQWNDAWAAGLAYYTLGADATINQTQFQEAQNGWLDTIGLMLGIPRYVDESDAIYGPRIQATILAWIGTVPALIQWLLFSTGSLGAVTENQPNVGYTIQFPGGLSQTIINNFLKSINRIRPAGVPFVVTAPALGLYLDTINYFDAWEVVGGYFPNIGQSLTNQIPALTPNAIPLLPDDLLLDPTVNPGSGA